MSFNNFTRYFDVRGARYEFVAEPTGEIYFYYHSGTTNDGQRVIQLDQFGHETRLDTELTGMGSSAVVVFRKVLDIIKEWVSIEKPSIIMFYAFEPSRQRVYNRLVLVLEKALPEYELNHCEDGYYILRRYK